MKDRSREMPKHTTPNPKKIDEASDAKQLKNKFINKRTRPTTDKIGPATPEMDPTRKLDRMTHSDHNRKRKHDPNKSSTGRRNARHERRKAGIKENKFAAAAKIICTMLEQPAEIIIERVKGIQDVAPYLVVLDGCLAENSDNDKLRSIRDIIYYDYKSRGNMTGPFVATMGDRLGRRLAEENSTKEAALLHNLYVNAVVWVECREDLGIDTSLPLTFTVRWCPSTDVASGDVALDFAYGTAVVGTVLDGNNTEVFATDITTTTANTANLIYETTYQFYVPNVVPEDGIFMAFQRQAAGGIGPTGDTYSGNIYIVNIELDAHFWH